MRGLGVDQLCVEAEAAQPLKLLLEHRVVLLAPRDFETARLHPVERLPGVPGESLDPLARKQHHLDHQVRRARVRGQARRPRRGLGREVVSVDEHDVDAPHCELKGGSGSEPTGADHDDVSVLQRPLA